ncbi:MAG TPA: O-antigen ligase family protein [Terriglobales bacterium]|nr:O-antigen ligase family protein [Terriglobales bacterium]
MKQKPAILDMPSPNFVSPTTVAEAPGWMRSAQMTGLLALLMFAPLAFGSTEPWSQFLLRAGAALLVLLWAVDKTFSSVEIKLNLVWVPLPGFACLAVWQIVGSGSVFRGASISEFLNLYAYGAAMLVAAGLFVRRRNLHQALTVLAVFGFVLATASILLAFEGSGKIYGLRTVTAKSAAIYGPYANHNHYAGLMEMLTPVTAAVAVLATGPRRWILGFASVIMAVSVAFSGSRGGMIGLAAGGLFISIFLFRDHNRKRGLFVIGVATAIVVAMVMMLGTDSIFKRFSEKPDAYRIAIYKDSLHMFTDKPVAGFGLGTFESAYPRYQSFWTDLRVNHAHNDYLELLVETGFVGFGLATWFLVIVFQNGIRKIRERHDIEGRVLTLGMMTGIICLLVHSLMDFNLHIPANALLFFVLCGAIATPFKHKIRPLDEVEWMENDALPETL